VVERRRGAAEVLELIRLDRGVITLLDRAGLAAQREE
jgi:hypothetical protein